MASQRMTATVGLTLVELVVVMGIALLLAGAAVPGVLAASRRAALGTAVGKVTAVIAEAQRLARFRPPAAGALAGQAHYGVALVTDEGAPYITLLHGSGPGDELRFDRDGDGSDDTPVRRLVLPGSVQVEIQPDQPRVAWFFAYGSGRPIASPAAQTPINVGDPGAAAKSTVTSLGSDWWSYRLFESTRPAVPPSPVCTALRLRERGGQLAWALAVYGCGLVAAGEVR